MASKQSIMVQVADHEWNKQALYYACALARRDDCKIALVKMVPVQHIGWLDTELGNLRLTDAERAELKDCAATVEDYGVEYSMHYFQYYALPDALRDAAEHVDADIVFATLPQGLFSWWNRLRDDTLRRKLARQQRVLIDKSSAKTLSDTDGMAELEARTALHPTHSE